jgi:uncharacterized protein YcfJ
VTRRRPVDVAVSAAIATGGTLTGCVAAALIYAATGNPLAAVAAAVAGLWAGTSLSDSVSDSDAYQQRAARHRLGR